MGDEPAAKGIASASPSFKINSTRFFNPQMIIPQPSSANCNLPGDLRVLHAARQTARQNFDSNFSLSPSSAEALAGIAHAEDVAQVLRRHVVQGERVGEEAVDQGGRYRKFFPLANKIR